MEETPVLLLASERSTECAWPPPPALPLRYWHLSAILIFEPRKAQSECSYRNLGRFPFHQNFQNFRIGRKRYGNVWRKSLELRGLLNFWKSNHSTKTFENSTSKIICNGNPWREIFENLGVPSEVIIFLEIPKNSVPFRKLRKIQPKLFDVVESALYQIAVIHPIPSWSRCRYFMYVSVLSE